VPVSVAARVSELADNVVLLSESFAAWHLLVHAEEREPYERAIERYAAFFVPTSAAHFQVVVVTIYQLTDQRTDTLSIPRVLEAARSVYPSVAGEVTSLLAPSREVFERIASIRLKVYSHRDHNVGPELVFREASLTPDLIGSCVSLLQHAVDALAAHCVPGSSAGSVWSRATHAADRTREQLRAILAAL